MNTKKTKRIFSLWTLHNKHNDQVYSLENNTIFGINTENARLIYSI